MNKGRVGDEDDNFYGETLAQAVAASSLEAPKAEQDLEQSGMEKGVLWGWDWIFRVLPSQTLQQFTKRVEERADGAVAVPSPADHTSRHPRADAPAAHPRRGGGDIVLQIQTVLQGSTRQVHLHRWVPGPLLFLYLLFCQSRG